LKPKFDIIKAKLKEYEDGRLELIEKLFHPFINKILVADKERLIYSVPKDKTYSNDKIRNNRKAPSQKLEISHGDFAKRPAPRHAEPTIKVAPI